ncbi:efflux RND transporter periplasmic adaptor subunit [Oceanidesulfovibrio indonesiensis]|uniref:Efflux RND transporter periplasmic adaptor subunit n=2 Tax=Oceanidesulfovibrio indonesiensis TaxID=54767 RepID=A0A7M3MF56_9BACT|nr:efflux RND transporter periplasmic adaptor subunit [Oceanidesulfovibrio indonesiensis]TVM17187.1 efflux RND transporter periplasmic adaptor subunit [Oceanidesulfovibrio indonesiensis]
MRMKKIAGPAVGVIGLVLLILWSGGFLDTDRIGPDTALTARVPRTYEGETPPTAQAERTEIVDWYEAVGTVRPRTETRVEAQVTAIIQEINVDPGDSVGKEDVLIVLDDRQLRSRMEQARRQMESARAGVEQAEQGVQAAQASFDRANSQYRRIRSLFEERAVAESELDQAEAEYLRARAGLEEARKGLAAAQATLEQASEAVQEAEIALSYATIQAHEAGVITERMADPGDLAVPGKPLLVMRTGANIRLEALVRESLIGKIRPGLEFPLRIPALGLTITGVVDEVVPSADPQTRTFLVKVSMPEQPGVYPGMFGRLLIPMGTRDAVLVPPQALRRIGQLETVIIRKPEGDGWRTVFVTTGRTNATAVEVLSGLQGGEVVALPQPPSAEPDVEMPAEEGANG